MAFRTWVRLLLATLGVGALAGASQLGMAYGLGIVRLTRVLDVTARDQWTAQLAWVAWFAMTAAVVGALAGSWLLPRWSPTRPGTGTTVAIAVAAGFGAAVVVPLTMQPARTTQVTGVHPVFVIGVCAGLGALAGVFAAAAALLQPVSRWNLAALGIAVWVLAIVSVSPSLAPGDPLPAVRLGVFDAGFLSSGVTQRTALFTMPALALIAGALVGWAARRRQRSTLTVALAGLPGPALLTAAYLIAGPGSGSERYQVVPYWAAMTAAGAGVLGSVLAAVLQRGAPAEAAADVEQPPIADRPPLPRRTSRPESAIALASAPPDSGPAPELSDTGIRNRGEASGHGPAAAGPDQVAGRPQTLDDTLGGGFPSTQGGGFPAAQSGGQHVAAEPKAPTPWAAEAWSVEPKAAEPWPTEPAPYVPEPATRPLPSDVLRTMPSETPSRSANVRLGRSMRPFSRGRVDRPSGDLDLGRTTGNLDLGRTTGDLDLGRTTGQPARHHAEPGPDQPPDVDAGERKRRGWRRGRSSDAAASTPAGPAAQSSPTRAASPASSAGRAFPAVPKKVGSENSRPFAGSPIRDDRTPAGRPFAAEPQTISAPLPQPEPISPPIATPEPALPPGADKRRSAKQRHQDDDYVDWVSGLGGE